MSTLAEKIRACLTLDADIGGAIFVEDEVVSVLAVELSRDDLETIADALEESDEERTDDGADVLRLEIGAAYEAIDDANEEIEKLKANLAERPAPTRPVAWRLAGPRPSVTLNAAEAQRHSDAGGVVQPLYGHPPAPEALPSREDLETVLRTAFDSGRVRLGADTVLFGERSGLIELNGRFYERDDGTPATFAQAVKVCADLVRAQKAEV